MKSNTIINITDEPAKILNSLLDLANNLPEYDGKTFRELFFTYKELMKNGKEFALFIASHLDRLTQLHFLDLQMNGLTLPFKNDYLNE
jgi:hypothetical protein